VLVAKGTLTHAAKLCTAQVAHKHHGCAYDSCHARSMQSYER